MTYHLLSARYNITGKILAAWLRWANSIMIFCRRKEMIGHFSINPEKECNIQSMEHCK